MLVKLISSRIARRRTNQKGEVNILMVMTVFLLLSTLSLGSLSIYYITQYNRASTTVEEEKALAATAAKAEQKQADEALFAERQKQPFRTYEAPSILASLSVKFPKNWNLYAQEDQGESAELNLYFNPALVKDEESAGGPYALRISLERTLYTEVLDENQSDVAEGALRATPITVSKIRGTRYEGQITAERQGTLVVLPVRDKTLSIWTESPDYTADFAKVLSLIKVSP